MRKCLLLVVFAIVVFSFSFVAIAEEYTFNNIYASIDIPESFIVITPDNMQAQSDFIESLNTSVEELQQKFSDEAILLQAWSDDKSACIEISAKQTDRSKLIFDVDQQSQQARGAYRVSYYPNNEYDGYNYKSSDWKNFGENVGRFLILKYEHFTNEIKDYTGLARNTIKNGHEISVNYKAIARKATVDDEKILNRVFKSWKFRQTNELSEVADAGISINKAPEEETKDRSVKIEGEAKQGTEFTAVVMSIGSSKPDIFKAVANEKNKFSLPITFSKQGVFLITLTASRDENELGEWAYPVTFKEGLLSVKFDGNVPETVYEDRCKIKGTAEPGAGIQVMLNNKTISNRSVGGDGKFMIPISTKQEGYYEVVLVFSKYKLETRRFKFTFNRAFSDEEKLEKISKKAVNATYGNLTKANEKFKGQAIRFNGHLADMIQIDDYYLLKIAYTKNEKKMNNFVYIKCDKPLPEQRIGKRVKGIAELQGFAYDVLANQDNPDIENLPILLLISYE